MPATKQNKKHKIKYAGKLAPPGKTSSTKKRKDTTPGYMKFFYGFMLVVLLMGSFARIARNRQTAPAPSTPTSAPASTLTPIPAAAGDPNQAVRDFLTIVEKNPADPSAQSYLSLELQDAVQSGTTIQDLLGLETPFTSFETAIVDPGLSGEAIVQATLNLVSPYEITFNLSNEAGTWHISKIQHQT